MRAIKKLFEFILLAIMIGLISTGCTNPVLTDTKNVNDSQIQSTVDKSVGGYVAGLPYICDTARDYDLQSEYINWKMAYLECTDEGLRVRRDAASNYDTVSEGIGYGMLLAVYFNDQGVFDGIYNYCKAHFVSSSTPLMHWKVDRWGRNISEFGDYAIDQNGIAIDGEYAYSHDAAIPHGEAYGNLNDGSVFILPPTSDPNYSLMKTSIESNDSYYKMNIYPRGGSSATDADQDIAAALCFATKVWPNGSTSGVDYSAEATSMITAIKQNDFGNAGGSANNTYGTGAYIRNGNAWGSPKGWNPSYFAPAYYKNVYAMQCPDQKDFWSNVMVTNYYEMTKLTNKYRNTGMYPDWCDTSAADGSINKADTAISDRYYYNYGTQGTGPSMAYPQSTMFAPGTSKADYTTRGKMSFNSYYDAIRVPWRIMTDYLWSGTKVIGMTLSVSKSLYYAYGNKVTSIVDGYSIDGGAWNWDNRDGFNNGVGGANHSTTFIAMSACAAMYKSNTDPQSIWNEVVNNPETDPTFNYYGNTLRLISMLMLSGRFEDLYNMPPPSGTLLSIRNKWQSTYMNIENAYNTNQNVGTVLECSNISGNPGQLSAHWIINRDSEGYYSFRSQWQPWDFDPYMHTEDQTGYAEWGRAVTGGNTGIVPQTGWWSSQWIIEKAFTNYLPDGFRFKNRWTGKYLYIENLLPATDNPNPNSVKVQTVSLSSSWNGDSAKWYFEKVQ